MIGVAIVGTGKVANTHALAYTAQPGCRLIRVCDVDPVRAAAFGARHGARPAASLDEVLLDPDVKEGSSNSLTHSRFCSKAKG